MSTSIQQNHIQKIIKLPIRNTKNKNKEIQERQNKFHSSERERRNKRSPIINSSYQHLISQYSKNKERYNTVKKNKKKRGKTNIFRKNIFKIPKKSRKILQRFK